MTMQVSPSHSKKLSPGITKCSGLVVIAFASVFFSRLIDALGAPSVINFAHFFIVPWICGTVLLKGRSFSREQIQIIYSLLLGIILLFMVIITSALVNNAGEVNAILSFMLLGEPFVMLLAVVSLNLSQDILEKFKKWVYGFFLFHIFFALAQNYVLGFRGIDTGMESADNIQGVFFLSGSGHVVGTSVSLSFGLYYLFVVKNVPIWWRLTVMVSAFVHMQVADGKQVLAAIMLGWILMALSKVEDIGKFISYLLGGGAFIGIFLWAVNNIPALSAFSVWMRPQLYGPQGEATLLKTAALRIVPTHYDSFLNWLFGLGPGHTVGRLGGWMLREYSDLLGPLGATRHEASREVWQAVGASWLGDQSSLFSPLFGWAGVWGDFGFLGLGAYLCLAYTVWRNICITDVSKVLVLSIFVFGLIFSQLEEPGYMLSIAMILGIQWHETVRTT
jgi:hypothetical protein